MKTCSTRIDNCQLKTYSLKAILKEALKDPKMKEFYDKSNTDHSQYFKIACYADDMEVTFEDLSE